MTQLPQDQAGAVAQLVPAMRARACLNSAVSTTAVDVALTDGTRRIEVTAEDEKIFLNFTTAAEDPATTTSFDRMLLPGQTRVFVLPVGVTDINVISDASATVYITEY